MDYESVRDYQEYFHYGENVAFIHYHKSIEIIYIFEGKFTCNVNGKDYELHEKELILIPPYHSHSFALDNKAVSQVNVLPTFCSDIYINALSDLTRDNLIMKDKDVALKILTHLQEIPDAKSAVLKDALYRYCLAKYLENIEKVPASTDNDPSFFYEVIKYVNKHYAEDISLEKIAEHFNYSKCYFSYLFNKNFHVNLNAYINHVRIQTAMDLLRKQSISQTAIDVGYSNLQSFFNNFNKIVKCTPKQYVQSILPQK